MASWTTPVLHAVSDTFANTDWNAVANNTTFLYQRPYVSIYQLNTQAVNTATVTQITLGGIAQIGYGFTVSSSNANVPIAGVYVSTGCVTFTAAGNLNVVSLIYRNGALALQAQAIGDPVGPVTSGIILCNAGDTLGLFGNQASGLSQQTVVGVQVTYLNAFYVGSM